MQRVLLVKLILIASAFSFPSHKNAGKDALLENGKQLMDKHRRNLVQFHNMIKCATGRSSSYYIDYGCYCGYGGRGTPVDHLDRCCQVHDACYGRIQKHPHLCSFSSEVYWRVYTGRGCTGCADRAGTCARAICECDGEAARCFARSRWNRAHYNYPAYRC